MSVRTVPRKYIYTCDRESCGAEHIHEGEGRYIDSTPPEWSRLRFGGGSHEGAGTMFIEACFCSRCTKYLKSMLNNWVKDTG